MAIHSVNSDIPLSICLLYVHRAVRLGAEISMLLPWVQKEFRPFTEETVAGVQPAACLFAKKKERYIIFEDK